MIFEKFIPLFSDQWKEKYHAVLAEEHLTALSENIRKYKSHALYWDVPFCHDELKIDRTDSFKKFIDIIESENSTISQAKELENIPFEHWLNILGQRITSASLRDENSIPPLKTVLLQAGETPFNEEITIAQRAWEKHAGRTEDKFWGEITGNNHQKQQLVMEKINDILDHKTWWNIFFHHKHGLVFEVREKEGHGIRWSHCGNRLIGFLEVFINKK